MCIVSAQGFSQHLGEHYLHKSLQTWTKNHKIYVAMRMELDVFSKSHWKTKNVALHFIYLWLLMEIGLYGLIAATGRVWIQQLCWCESDTRVAQCNEEPHLLITHPLKRHDVILVFPSAWLLVFVRHYSARQTTIRLDMRLIQFNLQYKNTHKRNVAVLVLTCCLLCSKHEFGFS